MASMSSVSTTSAGSGAAGYATISRRVAASSFWPRRASRRTRSRARRRATVRSQATGLSGSPSRGHRSSATRTASCSASSAASKSRSMRMSGPSTCPAWARYRAASRSSGRGTSTRLRAEVRRQVHHWANLDRTVLRTGDAAGQLEGTVEVLAVDDVVAAEDLLGLRERPVGRRRPAAADPHGGGGLDALERLAADELATLHDALRERVVVGHDLLALFGG